MNFSFGTRTYMMGILNVTPDSFSGDGIYKNLDASVSKAEELIGQGADIIDIGGESTRPGSESVSCEEEIERVIPVIKKLAKRIKVPISIDTAKPEVAWQALDSGAGIVNDITGLESNPKMAEVVASFNAKVVIMHIKGLPRTMQKNPAYDDLIGEIKEKLASLVKNAEAHGIKKENIIIDPGIGFGKTFEHNFEILRRLAEFKELGRPILVGPSRKSFIGNLLGVEPRDRIFGTAAAVALAIQNGADIVRVHDVEQMVQVAKIADKVVRRK